ncbi:PP2C family protein-serine/threonine phosphatase [Streptomyces sp. cmx-18-6]|uniref:PP2C family protein-serine/threonine phosphatase n=1 Tax=Streptomyces sp. cmx-18-6 TaxID=2790930 RepID=UPI00397F9D2A
MPSHLFADRPAPQPPAHDAVDALIHRTRQLRGDVDTVGRSVAEAEGNSSQARLQRALCDLAVQHLDDLDGRLGQLRAGLHARRGQDVGPQDGRGTTDGPPADAARSRVGNAEWNLLTDEVSWSEELYEIFGRPPGSSPLSLDDLPSVLLPEDQPRLTSMVTGCLVDGRPMDGEFRIVRPDGEVRTLHMTGEPVLDSEGCTAAMWAVLRDVSELRHGEETVDGSRDTAQPDEHDERTRRSEHRTAVEPERTVLPPWHDLLRLPQPAPGVLDIAAHYPPSPFSSSGLIGDWYDAMRLPDGRTLLAAGRLTGRGMPGAPDVAMLLGALRGMAVAGIEPGALTGHLDQLLLSSAGTAPGSALCCRFDPATGALSWARAGHPAPLLFRDGTARPLPSLDGARLTTTPRAASETASGAAFEQDEVRLLPGDVLVLHTGGPTSRGDRGAGPEALLALAPRLAQARTAQECVRCVVEESGAAERLDVGCVLVARVGA